jgi:hypothetical protein
MMGIRMKKAHWFFILYLLPIIFPVLVATFWGLRMGNPPLYELGKNCALMGFVLLAVLPVLLRPA